MARIRARQRRDGKARGVRVRTKGANARVKIANAKAARVKKPSKRGRPR